MPARRAISASDSPVRWRSRIPDTAAADAVGCDMASNVHYNENVRLCKNKSVRSV